MHVKLGKEALEQYGAAILLWWAILGQLGLSHLYGQPQNMTLQKVGSWNPELPSSYERSSGFDSISIFDNTAFVGTKYGVLSLDISHPAKPTPMGHVETGTRVRKTVFSDRHAFQLTFDGDFLQVVDLSDPEDLTLTGSLDLRETVEMQDRVNLAVFGSYAFILDRDYTPDTAAIILADVSDPTRPQLKGRFIRKSISYDLNLAAVGNHAFVVEGEEDDWLAVVDITDPAQPERVARVDIQGQIREITISGTTLVVGFNYNRFATFDVSDPTQPVEIDRMSAPEEHFQFTDNHVYSIIRWRQQARIFDIGDPFNPIQVGVLKTEHGEVTDVSIKDGFAYLATGGSPHKFCSYTGSLLVYDVSDWSDPVPVGHYFNGPFPCEQIGLNYPLITDKLLVDDDRIYSFLGPLSIIDLTRPSQPQEIGRYAPDLGDFINDVALIRDFIILAEETFKGRGVVEIINLADPSQPFRVAKVFYPDPVAKVRVKDHYAILLTREGDGSPTGHHVEILDIRQPHHPLPLGRFRLVAHDNAGFYVQGKRVVVTGVRRYGGGADSVVIDISDTASPFEVARIGTSRVDGHIVENGYFFGRDEKDLMIVDLNTFEQVGRYTVPHDIRSMTAHGHFAYVIDGNSLLTILDVSDPSKPNRVGRLQLSGYVFKTLVSGTHAIAAGDTVSWDFLGHRRLISLVDIGDPSHPRLMDETQIIGDDFALTSDHLIARRSFGFDIYRFVPLLRLNSPHINGSQVTLSWNGGEGIVLQQTSSLMNPVWQDVPGLTGESRIDRPISAASGFYRVIQSED